MNISRKIVPALISGILIAAPAFSAFAALEGLKARVQKQREKLQERIQERRENVIEKREEQKSNAQEKRENIQEKRQEAKQRLVEKRKQNIRAFFGRMAKRFEAALEREKKLGERIQSRLDKAKANGKDIVQAQAALDRAKTAWQEAKAVLENAKGKLEGMLASDDPKTAFDQIRSLVESARDKIKDAHAAYVDVIAALKGIGGGERRGQESATSTP